jgi:hypothetical protein
VSDYQKYNPFKAPLERRKKVAELDRLVRAMDILGPKCNFSTNDENVQQYKSLLRRSGELETELGL